tara:strand:+ start:5902 stop:9453 length:3552 start_codon:yes stop_codon:yes gene_type:complete
MQNIDNETIVQFLEGHDPQKYIVAIEAPYYANKAYLIINDPDKGKYIETHHYEPFVWMKHDVSRTLYGGDRNKIKDAMRLHSIKIKELRISNDEGYIPDRMQNGFRYLASSTNSYSALLNFFKEGGHDVYDSTKARNFMALNPTEQFLITTGKRMFKGMDDYDDIHRFQFDLETTGLDPRRESIFQIGMKDNRGYEMIIETIGDTPQELRDSERANIVKFFDEIIRIKPDTIVGYNSESFDWNFFEVRCGILGIPMEDIARTLNKTSKINRKDSQIKLGAETEYYKQTTMWGFNILDISHSVRRAQAINSDIKSWSLKYITKFSQVNKKNRVYVEGDALHKTWKRTSEDTFLFNNTNGDWFEYNPKDEDHTNKLESGKYELKSGSFIVRRYLLDDLWETEMVDGIYNQASFLLSKLLPTSYMRSSTMGTASQWKLILAAWSYEQNLGIPDYEAKRSFVGGLSRLIKVGFAKLVAKLDFAALYPKTTLTYNIFPTLDITGVMKGLLKYVVDTRDEFKFLTSEYKGIAKKFKADLEVTDPNSAEYQLLIDNISKYGKLASDADKKQLPLKILANSFFGSYGAPHIFPWGDSNCAERITCMSRQHLRLMVRWFMDKFGFDPLVGDTDGFNFALPDNLEEFCYTTKGNHWKTKMYGVTDLQGLEATVAEFNETLMEGWMGLDVDDICSTTINFKRKNYANMIDGKMKLVGNSIKSKRMPIYIEEFLDNAIKMLLDGNGHDFIQYYNEYVDKIYNYQIPLVKIASKARVKQTIDSYKKDCKTKTKAGHFKARKAHMELLLVNNLDANLGDTIYYVNIGKTKSTGDATKVVDKETGKISITLNCKLIPQAEIESNPDLTTDEYNVSKYIAALNKKLEPLLVCFSSEIRDEILVNLVKDRKTKDYVMKDKKVFTEKQCNLTSGQPINDTDQDTLEDFFTLADAEIEFWNKMNETPNQMTDEEWSVIRANWKERVRITRETGIENEKARLIDTCRRFEVLDLNIIETYGKIPKQIESFCYLNLEDKTLCSTEFGIPLGKLGMILDYHDEAFLRAKFYQTILTEMRGYIDEGKEYSDYDCWLWFLEEINDDRFEVGRYAKIKFWVDLIGILGFVMYYELSEDEIDSHWLKLIETQPYVKSEEIVKVVTEPTVEDESDTNVVEEESIETSRTISIMKDVKHKMISLEDDDWGF